MALSTLFFNDRKCLKIKTSSVLSPVVYTAAIMKPQQNNNTDLIFNDCSVLPHFLWSADINYFVVLTLSGDTIYPLLTFPMGSAWFASPNVIVRDPPAANRPCVRKASCGSASCIPSTSRRGLSGPPGALGPWSAAAGAQEGAGAERGGWRRQREGCQSASRGAQLPLPWLRLQGLRSRRRRDGIPRGEEEGGIHWADWAGRGSKGALWSTRSFW